MTLILDDNDLLRAHLAGEEVTFSLPISRTAEGNYTFSGRVGRREYISTLNEETYQRLFRELSHFKSREAK
ncbi:hypothetical protein KW805_04765 [Candidatus Pacearchaeota archaeon]|nr:hypothetical protein [Candidatus Pacearchaeota archaeon]